MDRAKAIFLASDAIALPALAALAGAPGVELVAVFTQPDRPAGRGQQLQANPVKQWCAEHGVPVRQPAKIGPEEAPWCLSTGVDFGVVMAYGQILPEVFLRAARQGLVNLHGSLLPALRGASPVETAIALRLPETGVSLMRVVRRMDAGPVGASARLPLSTAWDGPKARAELGLLAASLLLETLPSWRAGTLHFEAQDEAAATYCRKLTKDDGLADFQAPAEAVEARARAFAGWPGTLLRHGPTVLRGHGLSVLAGTHAAPPGTVLGLVSGGLAIACATGAIAVAELQRPGGRMLAAADFLRGYALPTGTVLEPAPPRDPLVLPHPFPRPPSP